MRFDVVGATGLTSPVDLTVRQVLVAGYTGRRRASVLEHIRELERLGVAPPPSVPMVYPIEPALLTRAARIEVPSSNTSGEAEIYLVATSGELLVGIGSDHTDREREAADVGASKANMPHPISAQTWRYDDVNDHWDSLEIRSWTAAGGERRLYQEGRLDAFLDVDALLGELRRAGYEDLSDTVIFGGTLPTLGGLVCGSAFEAELLDPVLGRRLRCPYEIRVVEGGPAENSQPTPAGA